ncbi:MAG: hypothetical protein ACXVGH_10370 [Mycobacteriales bacterium]
MPSRLLSSLSDPRGLAVGRTAVGLTMLARPELVPTALGVDAAAAEQTAWVVQMLGAREVALGAGALLGRRQPRLWAAAGLLCDAVDAVAIAAALGRGRLRTAPGVGAVVVAAGAAAVGAGALRRG